MSTQDEARRKQLEHIKPLLDEIIGHQIAQELPKIKEEVKKEAKEIIDKKNDNFELRKNKIIMILGSFYLDHKEKMDSDMCVAYGRLTALIEDL